MHTLHRILIVSVFLFSHYVTLAQQYAFNNITLEKSLPGNQIWSINQDSKGYMWFATTAGLLRFDGLNHILFGESNGLTSYLAFNVSEDRNKNIWIGCPGGISKFDLESQEMSTIIIGSFNNSYKVFADSYDRVWVYDFLFQGDLLVYENDSLKNYSKDYGFNKQRIIHIAQDNAGAVYLLTFDRKMYKFFKRQFQEIDFNNVVENIEARMFFFNIDGDVVLCGNNGVGLIKMSERKTQKTLQWLLKEASIYGLQDKQNDYWFATPRNGLFRIHKGKIQHITDQNGLSSASLYTAFNDREGNLWIGTNLGGVLKLASTRFTNFGKNEGLFDDAIITLLKSDSILYLGSDEGIYKFIEPKFFKIEMKNSSDNRQFKSPILCLVHSNDKLLVGCVRGLYELNRNNKVNLLGLEQYVINNLFRDSQNRFWVGTNSGIFQWYGGSNFTKVEFGVEDPYINSIIEVNNKDLYIATSKGLIFAENATSNFSNMTPTIFTIEDSLPSNNILSLDVDKAGNVIIATMNGLAVRSPSGSIYTITAGFNNPSIPAVFVDSKDRLWAGTNNGLHLLLQDSGKYIIRSVFYVRDGLASNEFTRSTTIVEGNDGRIWFGTYSGLTVYNPEESPTNYIKPLLYFDKVVINDQRIITLKNIEYNFSYSENKIRLLFQSPTFFDEAALKFEYYLNPIEKPWTNTTKAREISYSFLVPGSYIFKIRAINSFGVVSDIQEWNFVINPPFWNTIWFYFLGGVFLLVSIYTTIKYRLKRINQTNLRLGELVRKKTAELQESKNEIATNYEKLLEAQKQLVEKSKLENAYNEIKLLKDRLSIENIYLKGRQGMAAEIESVVGNSEVIKKIRSQIVEVGATDTTVLITGATGTGKNLVAVAIHSQSKRSERALISVNCAAIPSGLIESELFGHEKGAFTGANERHIGKFEMANDSTIFLDEIGDMSLPLQSKLLTVLQEKIFTRVGGNQTIKINTRVIAATNQELEILVQQGKFRYDLLYRLNIFQIHLPPLKERTKDIEILAKYFIDRYSREMNKKVRGITKSALKNLLEYDYPGNIRELENIIQRAMILCKGENMTDEHIVLNVRGAIKSDNNYIESNSDNFQLEEVEKKHIIKVLDATSWKIHGSDGAANILGLNPSTLRSRMHKLGIPFKKEKS